MNSNIERLSHVIKGPHVSEKAESLGQSQHQFVFQVDKTATKQEVKQALALLFGAAVKSVNMVHCRGKVKRFKQRLGKTKSWKKAYVTLRDKDADIKFLDSE